MINKSNLEKAKNILCNEVNNNLEIFGINDRNAGLLAESINNIMILIANLEDPKKAKYLDKLCN